MGSRATSQQNPTQTTTQTDNRIGASDNAIVGTHGARIGSTETSVSAGRDLTVTSLDPETIAGAFGLSQDVVDKLSALAGGAVQGSQNLAERISGQTSGVVERISDSFGRQISDLATTKATGGTNQFTQIIFAVIVAAVIGLYLWTRRSK